MSVDQTNAAHAQVLNAEHLATAIQQNSVWVAYASPTKHYYLELPFQQGMRVTDAIEQSGIRLQVELPEKLLVGIFGVRVENLEQYLQAGDRVELYRSLTINPKDIRRKRAAANPVSRYCRGNRFKSILN